jgi:HEAT repeat protein
LAAVILVTAVQAAGEQTAASLHSAIVRGAHEEYERSVRYIETKRPGDLLPLLKDTVLNDGDMERKDRAIDALSRYPFRSVSPLWMDLLRQSSSFPVKKRIIDVMAASDDRRVVAALVEELASPFSTVRESTIKALSKLGDDRMFPYILNMTRNPDPIYRVYALEAIYHLYDRRVGYLLRDLLKDENKSVRYYALKCTEHNNLAENMPIVRTLALSDPNWEVRIKSIELIRKFRDAASIHVLLRALGDENRDIRLAAALALLEFRSPAASSAVSAQLAVEDDDAIKELLIDALIVTRNGGGFRGIERVLSSDANVTLRIRAALACGDIGDARAIGLLMPALSDADYRVRAETCNSLGAFRGARAVTVKLQEVVCTETSLYVRLAALYALMRTGDRASMLPLYDQYVVETDPVFREKLRHAVRGFMTR